MRSLNRMVLRSIVWLFSSLLAGGLPTSMLFYALHLVAARSTQAIGERSSSAPIMVGFLVGTVGFMALYGRKLSVLFRANLAMVGMCLSAFWLCWCWYSHSLMSSRWASWSAIALMVLAWVIRHYYLEFERRGVVYHVKFR